MSESVLYLLVSCLNSENTTHFKELNCISQSGFAIGEQRNNFPLTQKFLYHASFLLGLDEGMDLVEGPK
jgi:hypothetical protein